MPSILLQTIGQLHSGLFSLVEFPPEGYTFHTNHKAMTDLVTRNAQNSALRWQLEEFLPLNLTKPWLEQFLDRNYRYYDLILGYNHVIFQKIPWIAQVEMAHALVGRGLNLFEKYKVIVRNKLASPQCKKILVWTEFAKRSLLINFDYPKEWHDKIAIIPQAVVKKQFQRNPNYESLNLLFVGSTNNPDTFVSKGGIEAIESFLLLNSVYHDLTLTIRANVPIWIRKKYAIEKHQDIRIVEQAQSQLGLESEFIKSDIFLYPTHEAHNFVLLDAMSFGLPIVTTEIGSTGRFQDGLDAVILQENPPRFNLLQLRSLGYNLPFDSVTINDIVHEKQTSPNFILLKALREYKERIIEEIVEKTTRLIDDAKLRSRIGETAMREVDSGKFSIDERNSKLKAVFDEALM